ncbi:MAG: AAA family ATPase [Candidatus Peribacteria bacterium]|jgi:ATP-dependent exoDNAse (exonuclease V) alpha subunit|nr:AAA family ATPase [Candidatus Peribacteria bacterium]
MPLTFDEKALQALYIMEKTNENLFLTGKAGTGKSTLLRSFIAHTQKNIAVLAPTGVAALNIEGSTIHSFFKIPPATTEKNVKKVAKAFIGDPKFTELDAIVIDEISMVRADLFDCINLYLQIVCETKQPFGGKQMLLIGDLYQLPPVVSSTERQFFTESYPSPYFFSSNVITSGAFKFTFHELEKVYRQQDQHFLDLLNGIRTKSLTDEMLDHLNQQIIPDQQREIAPGEMYLAGRNSKVDEINAQMLEKLSTPSVSFTAKIRGTMKESSYPTDEVLHLKVGAQVMFVVNDSNGQRVNGTLGTILAIQKDFVSVQLFDGETVEVTPHTRKVSQYVYNPTQRRLETEKIGSFTQLPLKLARACTIHKSQGKTFDKVIIDLQGGSFAHGQTYVALSRCKSLTGLKLIAPLQKSHILLDWQIVRFVTQYQQAAQTFEEISITELLTQAINKQEDLEIVYLKSGDQKSTRRITPKKIGTMTFQGKVFEGLQAFCHTAQDIRVFNVKKILKINNIKTVETSKKPKR